MISIIESQQLRVGVLLERCLNMSRVAEELRMTPSGVSHCIKTLEQDLGCRLFQRSSRSIVLTPAGAEFLVEAEVILARMKDVRERVRATTEERRGAVRLGVDTAFCRHVLPSVLREFRESFPSHQVKIDVMDHGEIVRRIKESSLDLGYIVETVPHAGCQKMPLVEDEWVFALHPLHPWAIKRRAIREEIGNRKLILPERGYLRAAVTAYFRAEGLSLTPALELSDEDAIRRYVEIDFGVGIAARWMLSAAIEDGKVTTLPLGRKKLRSTWVAVMSKTRTPTLAESLLVSMTRNVMRDLVQKVSAESAVGELVAKRPL